MIDISKDPKALNAFRVCLVLLYEDLKATNNAEVLGILRHYNAHVNENGFLDITLPMRGR